MIRATIIASVTALALYGILNAGRIGYLTTQRNHLRRDRDTWREEAQHWRNDASEQSQIIGRMRRGGM